MKKALVTGGCGFLGSSIVKLLLERGVKVRVLALPEETTENIDGLSVELVRGDIMDPDACKGAVKGMDTVFHCAAIYKDWMPDPRRMYEVNSSGTFNVLEASRRAKVKRVIYTASIASLGRPEPGALGDEDTPYNVWSLDFPYSRAKYHSRCIAEDFGRWGLDVRVVCPAIIFGPGDVGPTPSGRLIIESQNEANPPLCYEGGASYVDVRDAAEIHVLAAEKGKKGRRYLAVGHNLSHYDFLEAMGRAMGTKRSILTVPVSLARPVVKVMNLYADKTGKEPPLSTAFFEYGLEPPFFRNDRVRDELGATFRPIEESIRDAVEYFRGVGKIA